VNSTICSRSRERTLIVKVAAMSESVLRQSITSRL
jgi:hypothetical protein